MHMAKVYTIGLLSYYQCSLPEMATYMMYMSTLGHVPISDRPAGRLCLTGSRLRGTCERRHVQLLARGASNAIFQIGVSDVTGASVILSRLYNSADHTYPRHSVREGAQSVCGRGAVDGISTHLWPVATRITCRCGASPLNRAP